MPENFKVLHDCYKKERKERPREPRKTKVPPRDDGEFWFKNSFALETETKLNTGHVTAKLHPDKFENA